MEKVSWKGGALLAPLPAVMVSCGCLEKPNVMTVAWTGIINTQPSKTYISVRKSRYSYDLIKNSGVAVIAASGFPLGLGKISNGAVKNMYPKAWRLI